MWIKCSKIYLKVKKIHKPSKNSTKLLSYYPTKVPTGLSFLSELTFFLSWLTFSYKIVWLTCLL